MSTVYAELDRALTLLELQQQLIEAQQRQIRKLRIDLAHAREIRAFVLTMLDDVGALRKMLAST